MKKTHTLVIAGTLLLVLLAGCAAQPTQVPPTQAAQIANPASVNCADQGGSLEIVDTPNGQVGICAFSDASVCEEWSLFNKECKPGDVLPGDAALEDNEFSSVCLDQSGKIFSLTQDDQSVGMCVLPSAKICELSLLASGACQ